MCSSHSRPNDNHFLDAPFAVPECLIIFDEYEFEDECEHPIEDYRSDEMMTQHAELTRLEHKSGNDNDSQKRK
jgi:hypothetical protein